MTNQSIWIVSGLLYVLGVRQAYLALDPFDVEAWTAFLWPVLIIANILIGLYRCLVGDALWRRRHAKWCKEAR